jgi:hypothetical protein
MLFYPINLPLPILLTGTAELGLGLTLLLTARSPFSILGLTNREILVPSPTNPRIADTNRLLGLITAGLSAGYFAGSYMPLPENQFVHASVPVRLGLAVAMFGVCAIKGRRGMSEEGYWELLALGVFDVVGAVVVGWELGGIWDGKVRGWER